MKKLVQLKNKENEDLDPINSNYAKRISNLEGKILFESAEGINTSTNLKDAVSNYQRIKIYFRSNDGQGYQNSIEIDNPLGKIVPLRYETFVLGTMYIKFAQATINDNSINLNNCYEYYFANGQTPSIISNSNIYIVKVVGYK